jgi:predicted metalloprotease with PDZ domain
VGDTLTVHAFRRDELMTFDVTLQGERVPCILITVAPGTRKGPAVKRPSAS